MRKILASLIASWFLLGAAYGQPSPIKDPLLEHLSGAWVLRGVIAKKQTTHDVRADWVLGHQYLRLHEISREKDGKGQPLYEAIVLIGWDDTAREFQCLWLDSTGGGGLTAQAIARGKRTGETIPFLFKEPDGSVSFNNTFSYDKAADSWSWDLDNVVKGKTIPFGRVKLTRK
jgi:hypothetical protein